MIHRPIQNHNLFDINGKIDLVEHKTFKFSLVNLLKDQKIELPLEKVKRIPSVLNLQGEILINNQVVEKHSAVLFRDEEKLEVVALEDTTFLLIV